MEVDPPPSPSSSRPPPPPLEATPSYFDPVQMSRVWLVVVGLDNAGKTTTLYKLYLGEAVTAAPTIGSNVEEVVFKNLRFEKEAIRLWKPEEDYHGKEIKDRKVKGLGEIVRTETAAAIMN